MVFWDFFLLLLTMVYVISYFFVVVFVIIDLFRDDAMNGWGKALWIIALVFVPFLTALVYVIARGSGMAARANSSRVRSAPENDSYRPRASASPSDDIARAQALLDAGTISQGEFDALKSKALGNQFFGA
ncbi:PLDc N-terminal domain-containing protein [Microbacterium sp. RU33B]|uniref:PLDc N-terminal domain-containing protein n=1 Tax=Microbacterium sp. RU33B TaxID=1907390 RepID=UPI000968427B|nr:PLDc N-terminal domain-containing protein [Microbacterium sp. RU33B]SIT75500.1 Phospholipase_D-nuclease N-terminal [Microbacterium sp. RU33B]